MPPSSPNAPGSAADERRPWLLLFVAVCLVAVNLRMTITGVGPLLDQIGADQGISTAVLGLLGSLVLLTWGLFSPLAHGVAARIGMTNAVSWSLAVLAAGTVLRSLPGSPANLWVGTAITGLGLAISNVLLPAVIKRDFPNRIPLVMGVYSALLGGLGAVGAGIVVPISEFESGGAPIGWRAALLATGALIPVALVVWMRATRSNAPRRAVASTEAGEPQGPGGDQAGRRIWGDPVAWLVSLYMGTQSTIFYVLAAWFPLYQVSLGVSAVAAGVGLMIFQFLGIAGSLLMPALARGGLRRWLPALLPAFGTIAWAGLIVAPAALPAWIVIGGLTCGAQLTMSLTLMATRARTSSHSTALSGMAQSVGYLIAGVGPAVFGWLLGTQGDWALAFTVLWAAAAVQFAVGVAVGRRRFVLDR
ncbi:MFS transporter [Leucobacter sp. GX0328]